MLRADATTIGRLRNLIGEARQRGGRFLVTRLIVEYGAPKKLPGRLYRVLSVGLYLALFKTAGSLMKPFLTADDRVILFYDLNIAPVTYDVVWGLAAAEMLRREVNAPGIHFVVVMGKKNGFRTEAPEYEAAVPLALRRERLERIVLRLPEFLASVTKTTIYRSRIRASLMRATCHSHVYPINYWPGFPSAPAPRDVMTQVRAGEPAPDVLRAKPADLDAFAAWLGAQAEGRKLITITLRSYAHYPIRNSNIDAWRKFAERLDKEQYCPVFIPDTGMPAEEAAALLNGFDICIEAARDIGIRMAAYETAYLNLMVNNGPHGLCLFNHRIRYLMFKILTPEAPQTTPEYMEYLGFELGKDPPFASRFQKWVWQDDNLEVIEHAFHEMEARIEQSNVSG